MYKFFILFLNPIPLTSISRTCHELRLLLVIGTMLDPLLHRSK